MHPGTNSLEAATVFAHSKSTHLLAPPASPPARAGAVQSFRTSDSNTRSVPHAPSLPPGIAPGHPPFLAPTRIGSPVSFPVLSGRHLANPRVFLDSAAAAASVPAKNNPACP